MSNFKTCNNDKCRKRFHESDAKDDEHFCSIKCENEHQGRKKGGRSNFTTISIKPPLKAKIKQVRLNIEKKTEKSVSYNDLIETLLSILERKGNLDEELIKEFS